MNLRPARPGFRPRTRLMAALFALLPVFSIAAAGIAADAHLTGAEKTALFEKFRERQAGVRSFRANVTQKKSSPMLVAEVVTGGRILFGKPDRFRWETDRPERLVVVADGTNMTVYHPDRKDAERHDQRDQFAARMAVEFMASGMGGSLADLEKRFRVDVSREDDLLVMTLKPKARWFQRVVASITVYQRENQAIPERIVVQGEKGDRTETSLGEVTINPPLQADAFTLKLPPGVRLFDAKQRAESGIDAP